MGDSWSPGCAYTGSPNLDLGANDPRSPVSVDPWLHILLIHKVQSKIAHSAFLIKQNYTKSILQLIKSSFYVASLINVFIVKDFVACSPTVAMEFANHKMRTT